MTIYIAFQVGALAALVFGWFEYPINLQVAGGLIGYSLVLLVSETV